MKRSRQEAGLRSKQRSLRQVKEIDSNKLRQSYIRKCVKNNGLKPTDISEEEVLFLAEEVNRDVSFVRENLEKNLK